MARWDRRSTLLVAASLALLLGLLGGLALEAGRPYPGFFATPDYYVVPIEPAARAAGLRAGDRLVAVEVAPRILTWSRLVDHFGVYFLVSAIMLIVGAAVFVQNPSAAPNRRFLLYMCLWAVSNVAVPEAVLGARPYAGALVGLLAPLLSIHGWI